MQTWTVKELREALSDPRMDDYKVSLFIKNYTGKIGPIEDSYFAVGYDKEKKELTIEN